MPLCRADLRPATQQAAAARQPVDQCADYLLKYRAYLRYDQYLAAGLPIATGVIEGACRHLVKDRLELMGARWPLSGAEAVLRLRSLRASDDFEEYWDWALQLCRIARRLFRCRESAAIQ